MGSRAVTTIIVLAVIGFAGATLAARAEERSIESVSVSQGQTSWQVSCAEQYGACEDLYRLVSDTPTSQSIVISAEGLELVLTPGSLAYHQALPLVTSSAPAPVASKLISAAR